MLKLVIVILLCVSCSSTYSQKPMYFGWNFGLGMAPSDVDYTNLPYNNLKAKPGLTALFGLRFGYALSSNLFMQTGFKAQYKFWWVGYPKGFTRHDYVAIYADMYSFVFSVPLEIKFKLPVFKNRERTFLAVTGGILLEYYPETFKIGLNTGLYDFDNWEFYNYTAAMEVKEKFAPSTKIGIGINRVTKKGNMLEISLNYSYSPFKVMKGTFIYWEGIYFEFLDDFNALDPDLTSYPPPNETYNFFAKGNTITLEITHWLNLPKKGK